MDKDINSVYEEYLGLMDRLDAAPDDKQIESEATESFLQLFDLIKMFLILKKERYYGYFLLNMDTKLDFHYSHAAGVNADTYPFTLKINPLHMRRYSIKEMVFIVCHEIEHLVLNHPAEGLRLNKEKDLKKHMLLNIAMDASVNDRLDMEIEKYDIGMMKCPGDVITSKFLSGQCNRKLTPLREFTYYYYNIPKNMVGVIEVSRIDSHEWTINDSPEDIEAAIKVFVENSVQGISDEDRGKLPAYQREFIQRILAPPKIQWQSVLRKYVGTLPDGYRKTKTRLSRRQPERYDISGRVRSRIVKIVVAIDTSASMSSDILKEIFVEIFAILKHVKHEITIIECDSEVQKVYKANNMADVSLEIKGRGGTSFIPVIEYINKEGKFRDALLVFFTDGYGDRDIPKPMTYRNLWITTSGYISLSEPYGEVIEF